MVTKNKIRSWNVSIICPLTSNVYAKYYGIYSECVADGNFVDYKAIYF